MTQQSCEHRDLHDVFFPSGLFVKQQQTQCQTPHTHLCANQPVRHPIILREVLSRRGAAAPTKLSGGRPTPTRHRAGVASMAWRAFMIQPWARSAGTFDICTGTHQSSQNQQQKSHGTMPWMKRPMHQ